MENLQAVLRSAEPDAAGLTWFRATSEAKDRHGTIIEAAGVDVGPFLRNPIVGWGHRAIRGGDPDDVLGRVDSIERGDGFIDVGVRFADHERAQLTEKLVRDGFLSAMSVGILPRKTATRTVGGQRVPVIEKSELLEVSIVPVGSNPEAQRLLRDMLGETPEETNGMESAEIRSAIEEAVKPLGERLEAIEKTLDEPEDGKVPALAGARTTEDVDDLGGRWLRARAFKDQRTLLEIAERDTMPEAELRDMFAADSYTPTQISSQLVQLIGYSSDFFGRVDRITGSGATIRVPRESAKLVAAFVAENASVILGDAAVDSVVLTAHSAWSGERISNRALSDSPVAVFRMLRRQAADAHAALFDTQVVEGSTGAGETVTSGLEDLTAHATVTHTDSPADAATAINQVAAQYFAAPEEIRRRSTWVVNSSYAEALSTLLDSNTRPVFQFADNPPGAAIDGATQSTLFGRPVIVSDDVDADECYFGDLSRALLHYLRQGVASEISRDAEFALDNSLIRIGMRWDVAVVEANQVLRFTA